MIRHLIMWDHKDGFSEAERAENVRKMREKLEALVGVVPGLVSLKIVSDVLPNSNKPILLNSLFESEAALEAYIPHPAHASAAEFVRSVTQNRSCVDYAE